MMAAFYGRLIAIYKAKQKNLAMSMNLYRGQNCFTWCHDWRRDVNKNTNTTTFSIVLMIVICGLTQLMNIRHGMSPPDVES